MKGWERDLLDHLVWLTLTYEDDPISTDEVVAQLKREFSSLAAAEKPSVAPEPS